MAIRRESGFQAGASSLITTPALESVLASSRAPEPSTFATMSDVFVPCSRRKATRWPSSETLGRVSVAGTR